MTRGFDVLLFAALLTPSAAEAADCGGLADVIGRAAARRSVRRVAVIPFMGPRGGATYSGSVIAERLVTELLSNDSLEVIERPMLESVLKEQKLGMFGIMDPGTAKALGRVLGVDALLTGTATALKDGRVEVNARLIHAETAQVLAAASTRLDQDWQEPLGAGGDVLNVPVPELEGDWSARLDAELGRGCRERVDELERSLIDLKAKYWAAKLKDPAFSPRELTRNPGSEIQNLGIRKIFYGELHKRYYQDESRPLTRDESAELAQGLQRLQALTLACDG